MTAQKVREKSESTLKINCTVFLSQEEEAILRRNYKEWQKACSPDCDNYSFAEFIQAGAQLFIDNEVKATRERQIHG